MPFESKNFQDIKLDDVRDLVGHSVGEPLLWEAKGSSVRPEHISRVACSFANGLDKGYLILGVDESGQGEWHFPGRDMNETEPRTWVSDILMNNLRPCPKFDVVDFEGETERGRVVVIEVEPLATPPCIANGTVFERVPGQSPRVSDPMRLAELYQRGKLARETARSLADRRAEEVFHRRTDSEDYEEVPLRFGLAVTTAGLNPDISKVLFTARFEQVMRATCGAEFVPGEPMPEIVRPETQHRVAQDRQTVYLLDRSDPWEARDWLIEAGWDGSVGVRYQTTLPVYDVESIVEYSVKRALAAAGHLIDSLGGYGEVYLTLAIVGGHNLGGNLNATLRRGPFGLPVDEAFLAGLSRELNRATGNPEYEDQVDE